MLPDSIEKTIGEKVKNLVEKSHVDWPAEWIGKVMLDVIEESINHILEKQMSEATTEGTLGSLIELVDDHKL